MSRVDVKIVLLGHENVGKTSLVERYVHDHFNDNCYQNTIGAAFAAKQVESRGKKVTIGIWDTAGSERYEAMSRIYYRGAKAAVVCYDICNQASWDRAKFWISELRRHEEACKVYLCGTKLDLGSRAGQRQVMSQRATKYADGIQATHVETSSKTGENVGTLFQKIADDYLADPENMKKVEDTISLSCGKSKRHHCCHGGS